MTTRLCGIALMLTACLTAFSQKKSNISRPNIIIIFMDDMGYGDLEDYGATGYRTPNLTALARNGMRFTNFYAAQAVCSASRAGLLTGCYPNRVGISGALFPNVKTGLRADEQTIAELLKTAGYKTQMIGKWHLGNEPAFLPTTQGFDDYLGLPYSNDMWPIDYDGTPAKAGSSKRQFPVLPLLHSSAGVSIPDTVMKIQTLDDQAQLTTLYTEKAVSFIHNNSKSPFFLYLAHSMTHVPIAVSSKFKGKSQQGLFGDVMMEIDWSVQQIVQALKETSNEENTLIIFTSDNGPWLNFGNHAGTTAGLREGKGASWEGGMREACIISWPAAIPKGVVSNQLMCTIDVLPTLAAVTGTALPSHPIDGINMLPLLKGNDKALRDTLYYYYNRNDLEGVRIGQWKLVLPHKYRSYERVLPGNDGFPGPYSDGKTDSVELYDLRRDPGERYDVSKQYPQLVSSMMGAVEKARADLGDDLTKSEGSGRRPVGKLP